MQNQLLAALPPAEMRRLQPHLEAVPLEFQQILHDPGRPPQHVYFPTAGVISTMLVLEGRITIEAAMVGREGMVGLPLFLGLGNNDNRQAMVLQVGSALRLAVDAFREAATPDNALHDLLLRYTEAYLNQVCYTSACNRFHSIEQHVCCWLLQLHDRLDGNRIALTQELFAQQLGVRRASITAAARKLQWDDVIHYHWGPDEDSRPQGAGDRRVLLLQGHSRWFRSPVPAHAARRRKLTDGKTPDRKARIVYAGRGVRRELSRGRVVMRRPLLIGILTGLFLLTSALPPRAVDRKALDQAVERGVAALRNLQRFDGTWPHPKIGATSLAALTLLECGVKADDPAVKKAANAVRLTGIQLTDTYSLALSILFLDRLDDPNDVPLIESMALRLLAGQNKMGGWEYNCPGVSDAEVRRLTTRPKCARADRAQENQPKDLPRASGPSIICPRKFASSCATSSDRGGRPGATWV